VSQARQQHVIIWLTVMIALAIIAFTWTTWKIRRIDAGRKSIQRQLLQQSQKTP
jgi:hypothetical protein